MHCDTLKAFHVEERADPRVLRGPSPTRRSHSTYGPSPLYRQKSIQLVRVREFQSASISPPRRLTSPKRVSPPKAAPRALAPVMFECQQALKWSYTSETLYLLVYGTICPLTVLLPGILVVENEEDEGLTTTTTVISYQKVLTHFDKQFLFSVLFFFRFCVHKIEKFNLLFLEKIQQGKSRGDCPRVFDVLSLPGEDSLS